MIGTNLDRVGASRRCERPSRRRSRRPKHPSFRVRANATSSSPAWLRARGDGRYPRREPPRRELGCRGGEVHSVFSHWRTEPVVGAARGRRLTVDVAVRRRKLFQIDDARDSAEPTLDVAVRPRASADTRLGRPGIRPRFGIDESYGARPWSERRSAALPPASIRRSSARRSSRCLGRATKPESDPLASATRLLTSLVASSASNRWLAASDRGARPTLTRAVGLAPPVEAATRPGQCFFFVVVVVGGALVGVGATAEAAGVTTTCWLANAIAGRSSTQVLPGVKRIG